MRTPHLLRREWRWLTCLATILGALASNSFAKSDLPEQRRYPVADEAFYVLSCMAKNGQGADVLSRCSCAVAAIESRLSHDRYLDAQMVLSLRQAGGERAAIFRDDSSMKLIVKDFVDAQREANAECFGAKRTSED